MDFNSLFSTKKPEIDSEIEDILSDLTEKANVFHPSLSELIELFRESCQGGKRIRGIFVLLGVLLAGGELDKETTKIAAAFEIFHTAILLHDDIMDNSQRRRNKPTIHHVLGGHYGIAQAISLGDIGMFLAANVLSRSTLPEKRKNKAIILFTTYTIDTVLGQMMDVSLPKQSSQDEDEIVTIMKLKTARYSIISPLQVGASLGGADDPLLENIERFGEELGIAYQIHDDILGIFGSEQVIGKSTLSDIEEEKMTLLYSKAREKANTEQRDLLNKYYGVKADKEALEKVRTIFIETGAYDYATSIMEKHLATARTLVTTLSDEPSLRQLFLDVIDYLSKRQS